MFLVFVGQGKISVDGKKFSKFRKGLCQCLGIVDIVNDKGWLRLSFAIIYESGGYINATNAQVG